MIRPPPQCRAPRDRRGSCGSWLPFSGCLLCDLDDRLAVGAPAGGECRGRLREGPHGPHERLDPAVSEPLSKVREPGTVGFDDEEHGPPVAGLDGGWRCDGDQRAAGADQRGRAFEDLAADHVEHHVDLAGIFQLIGLQVQEGIRAETECGVPVGGPSGADHPAPASRASCTAIEPTPPAGPWIRTVWPVVRRPWSNRPCQAVGAEIGRAAATVWSTSAGSGARLRASTAAYPASEPLRVQSVSPNTRWPTVRPVVPYPSSATTPESSCPGTLGARSWPARSVHVPGQSSSPRVNPAACTRTMTSFWAARGYGISVRESAPTPVARSRTVRACMAVPIIPSCIGVLVDITGLSLTSVSGALRPRANTFESASRRGVSTPWRPGLPADGQDGPGRRDRVRRQREPLCGRPHPRGLLRPDYADHDQDDRGSV